jgi:hypothetical protein
VSVIDNLARDLHIEPGELIKKGVRSFLNKRLSAVESELFLLAKKYGVKDVFEFDKKIKEGKFSEDEVFEDYFKFDNLQAEKNKLKKYLDKI